MRISFFLRTPKKSESGKSLIAKARPVRIEIEVNARKMQFSCGLQCLPSQWDCSTQRAITKGVSNNVQNAKKINRVLDDLRIKFEEIETLYNLRKKSLTVERVKEMLFGEVLPDYGLLELVDKYISIEVGRKLTNSEVTDATLKAWQASRKNLELWVQSLNKKDVLVTDELCRGNFDDIKYFFLNTLNFSHNYVAKKLSGYVSVLEWATNNDFIEKNIFRGLFMTKKDDKVDWLETKDIECITSASFATNMLNHVRDFFLFCTYTGLSYQDYIELDDTKHLQEIKGRLWIIKQRAKGENQDYGDFEVPLFEPAKQLLEKYGSLKNLPKMANQTFNRLLKEMGNILGNGLDGTRLTCHLARHTFIWWALNIKKMSRESVSRMVGHSDTRMLNKYAPITRTRIEGELDDLGE